MKLHSKASRLQRKWRKLQRDPVRFFVDAGNPLIRTGGLYCLVVGHFLGGIPAALLRTFDCLRSRSRAREISLMPANQLERECDGWVSTGEDPQFHITIDPGRPPRGWILFSIEFADLDECMEPVIYVDEGAGFSEHTTIRLPSVSSGAVTRLVWLPRRVRALRLDPLSRPGRLQINHFDLQSLGSLAALKHALCASDSDLATALSLCRRTAYSRNVEAGISREEYAVWIRARDTLSDTCRDTIRTAIRELSAPPVFSVLMPVHNTRMAWLREAVVSIRSQLYPHWELCIVNDASITEGIAVWLDELAAEDERIHVRHRECNGGIVVASNEALALATGGWIVCVDHDDRLAEQALYRLAEAINQHPDAAILYSDHDHIDTAGERYDPYFKPDWNYELALGQNYVNHLSVFRAQDVRDVGGFRAGYDGSQDWDLLLRLVENTTPENIIHIHRVLYHWRVTSDNFSHRRAAEAWQAGQLAVEEHLHRTGQQAKVSPGATRAGHLDVCWQLPADPPLVSIIIPTRDRLDLLRCCIESVLNRTNYPQYEILIVDNGSVEKETLSWYCGLAQDPRIRILDKPGEFNFSRLCNHGMEAARGEVYVLLNNDTEVINADWLSVMVAQALRPGVGAVGAKLYYPNGTVQHGGVVLGIGGVAGHVHQYLPAHADGYHGRARLTQRMSAVTAACLAGRRDIYLQVGGMDEVNLKVAFNDVDLCLKLVSQGYAVIWTPGAELYHHESASRGSDDSPGKGDRFQAEAAWVRQRWAKELIADPAYNRNLSLHLPGYKLEPEQVTH